MTLMDNTAQCIVAHAHYHVTIYSYCSFIETSPRPVDEEEGEYFLFDITDEER